MQTRRRRLLMLGCLSAMLQACGGDGGDPGAPPPDPPAPPPPPAGAAVWSGHGGDAQHTAAASVATQAPNRILWSTPVDLVPPYRNGGLLLIHYGSPVITGAGTVLVPVKTSAQGDFRVEARLGDSGALVWQQASDYVLPVAAWTPSFNLALDADNRLFMPAAGGRLWIRDDADSATGNARFLAFYGDDVHAANAAALNDQVRINTPLTVDADGHLFFGFIADAGNPAGLASGIVRLAADGTALWAAAATLAADATVSKVATNCAPALSRDGSTLYVAVNGDATQTGYLLALDAATLAVKARQLLRTPVSGTPLARVSDLSTASPTIGPDGDVFYGVLDASNATHNARGWLLHFDATLSTLKTPGSFGWDDTPSIVPASVVGAYAGSSSYLLLCKYNNYYGAGSGDGLNRMAILDPQATQDDPIVSGVTVLAEVITVLGPTADPGTVGGVREWCVSTAVVDAATKSAFINSEDGRLYRWDLQTGALGPGLKMNDGVGQAYTSTVSGPTGIVYAINNAQLHAVGA